MQDTWYPNPFHEELDYYDILNFNSDTLDVAEDQNTIAEMYFRLDIDLIKHERSVYKLMDLLGDIGGVADILI